MRWLPHVQHPRENAIAAFVAIGVFAPVLWMALDRMPPYEITNGRIDPSNPVKGTEFTVTWDIRALRSCQVQNSSVTRVIISKQGFSYRAVPDKATYGTPEQRRTDEIKRPVKLPENIVGPARYYADVCYVCNMLQEIWPICMRTPTLDFVIAE